MPQEIKIVDSGLYFLGALIAISLMGIEGALGEIVHYLHIIADKIH